MSVAMVGLTGETDLVIGAPGEQCPPALPSGCLAGAVVIVPGEDSDAAPLLLHQDSEAPHPMADEREPAFSAMPWDDIYSESSDDGLPTGNPTGEWLGWATAA
jgi:hypothetical protein